MPKLIKIKFDADKLGKIAHDAEYLSRARLNGVTLTTADATFEWTYNTSRHDKDVWANAAIAVWNAITGESVPKRVIKSRGEPDSRGEY
jgi:hypothetical protein